MDADIHVRDIDVKAAETDRDTAETAIARIEQVTSADGLNDSWWDKFAAVLQALARITEKIAMITGILALLFSWVPVLGPALLAVSALAGLISAVANLALAAGGKQSWTQAITSVLFAALGCVGLGGMRGMLGAVKGLSGLKTAIKSIGGLKGLVTGTITHGLAAIKGTFGAIKGLGGKLQSLGGSLKNLKLSVRFSGGSIIGSSPVSAFLRNAWAEEAYRIFRNMDGDVARIATTIEGRTLPSGTVIGRTEVSALKEHLFITEHPLDRGMSRYDPSASMAEAWERLIEGTPMPEDLLLLDHEYAEMMYYRANPGASYREAHNAANTIANWEALGLE